MDYDAPEYSIEYEGLSTWTSPLTAGQFFVWDVIESLGGNDSHINVEVSVELPAHTHLSQALNSLRSVVVATEVLRTQFVSINGEPHQHVLGSGELRVEVLADRDPSTALLAVLKRLTGGSFDLSAGVPVRAAVITSLAGEARYVAIGMSHMVVDGLGAEILTERLSNAMRDAVLDTTALPSRTMIDQQAFEASDAGVRIFEESLPYWRTIIAKAPLLGRALQRHSPSAPRYQKTELTWELLVPALTQVARSSRTSESVVAMAAFARTLARYTGGELQIVMVRTRNRMERSNMNTIGPFSQAVPVIIDASPASLDACARQLLKATLTAYEFGRIHPKQVNELVREVKHVRGEELNLDVSFNSLLGRSIDWIGNEEGIEMPPKITKGISASHENVTAFLEIRRDRKISLFADTAFLDTAEQAAFLVDLASDVISHSPHSSLLSRQLPPPGATCSINESFVTPGGYR